MKKEIRFKTDIEVDKERLQKEQEFARFIIDADNELTTPNEQRINDLNRAVKMIIKSVGGTGVKIEHYIHKPLKSSGYISITGKKIVIKNRELYTAACKLADIVEIYPRTDGLTSIELTFNNMML